MSLFVDLVGSEAQNLLGASVYAQTATLAVVGLKG
jgi:hypothetical protein